MGSRTMRSISLDPEGRVISWNEGAARIKGYRTEEILGKHFSCFYIPEDRVSDKPSRELQESLSKGRFEEQAQRVRKNGSVFWANVVITPMYDDSGALRGFSKIARDITERKRGEEALQEQSKALEAQTLMLQSVLDCMAEGLVAADEQGKFLIWNRAAERIVGYGPADLPAGEWSEHYGNYLPDGVTPMPTEQLPLVRAIRGEANTTEIFVRNPAIAEGARHYLERIQAGSHQMGLLVDELLNLARVGRHALNRQPTKLNSIVAEVIAILQPDTEGRQVQWEIADLPAVECDSVLIKQIFQNLLANALKFTRPRAHAVIEVNHKQETDGQVVFMVRDNGIGFNMKYVDKLFGVFQRLHSADEFEGTGIGLVTVQRIVQKHGGRVWAEAELDKGAAFYFTLGVGKQAEPKSNGATAGG